MIFPTRHILLLITAMFALSIIYAQDFTSSNLPIVVIETHGNTINNENDIRAKMKIVYHENGQRNYLSDTSNLTDLNYNGNIEIKVRGYTSQSTSKKPYKVHTVNENNENNNVSLLGLPPENDWVLNNISYDPSYIRDYISYGLSEKMGNYAPRCRYCEVVINGDYRGLYVFTEKLKVDKNRIDIEKTPENPQDTTATGYLIKADREEAHWQDYAYNHQTIDYTVKYPKLEYITPQQMDYIRNYYFKFTELVNSQNNAIDVGIPSMIDIQSFIDYMLMGEFSSNVDIYQLSTFFHKDAKGKLRAGPVWDFNLTFGNDLPTINRSLYNVWQFSNGSNEGSKFWTDLFNNSTFRCHLSKRWYELTSEHQPLNYETVCSFIEETRLIIEEAVPRDCARWQIANQQTSNIDTLKGWIQKRIEWMNSNIGSNEQCQDEYVPNLVISRINYNPKSQGLVNSDMLEFIEITNNSDDRVNLTGIYFGGMGLSYIFPINSFLQPHQSAIICSDSLQFVNHYAQIPFGQYTRHLSNQSQQLVLLDAWGNLIDAVTYSCNPPWPLEANGQGSFLELIDVNLDNSFAENWRASEYLSVKEMNKNLISIYPNPFSDNIRIETNSYDKTTYSIINAVGVEILYGESQSDVINVNTIGISSGIYFVRVTSGKETICVKIVKQ